MKKPIKILATLLVFSLVLVPVFILGGQAPQRAQAPVSQEERQFLRRVGATHRRISDFQKDYRDPKQEAIDFAALGEQPASPFDVPRLREAHRLHLLSFHRFAHQAQL